MQAQLNYIVGQLMNQLCYDNGISADRATMAASTFTIRDKNGYVPEELADITNGEEFTVIIVRGEQENRRFGQLFNDALDPFDPSKRENRN
jgi:hypothetical protein